MINAKLASQSHLHHQTIVKVSEQVAFGGKELVIIGGPCTVESLEQMETVARFLLRPYKLCVAVSTSRERHPTLFREWEKKD